MWVPITRLWDTLGDLYNLDALDTMVRPPRPRRLTAVVLYPFTPVQPRSAVPYPTAASTAETLCVAVITVLEPAVADARPVRKQECAGHQLGPLQPRFRASPTTSKRRTRLGRPRVARAALQPSYGESRKRGRVEREDRAANAREREPDTGRQAEEGQAETRPGRRDTTRFETGPRATQAVDFID